MKVIIASDSFKGCLSSAQVADAVAEGILSIFPSAQVVKVPVADGGEGTVVALGSETVRTVVSDPLGRPVEAAYGINGDTAVIEVAATPPGTPPEEALKAEIASVNIRNAATELKLPYLCI